MVVLRVGDPAPEFELPDESGRGVRLSSLRGRPVVLYFYPQDDTPGCTTEACGFRDSFPRFEQAKATILGVSPDDAASHRAFKAKFGLPFTLLSDPDHRVAELYGAWGRKTWQGREFDGILRSTFVIGPEGRIVSIFRDVMVEGHDRAVLEALAP